MRGLVVGQGSYDVLTQLARYNVLKSRFHRKLISSSLQMLTAVPHDLPSIDILHLIYGFLITDK
jgi:hypothetical protein